MSFASPQDYELCKRIQRHYGKSYFFATQLFPKRLAQRVHAIYGFVRVPDEWVDNPEGLTQEEASCKLDDWLRQFEQRQPEHPVMRAFCDVAQACNMPPEEPRLFIEAMKMDLSTTRYRTYSELQTYMRGSASAVGLMMCSALEIPNENGLYRAAALLGEAMQMTNFLRDIAEDVQRGRIYMPLQDLDRFGVTEDDLFEGRMSDPFINLMRFEIVRTRALYAECDEAILQLPREALRPIALARVLYAQILDKIEDQNYNVFAGRAKTSRLEKLQSAAQVIANPRGILRSLGSTDTTRQVLG